MALWWGEAPLSSRQGKHIDLPLLYLRWGIKRLGPILSAFSYDCVKEQALLDLLC